MKTIIIHKNSIGGVLDQVIVDDSVGTEKTLATLLTGDWCLDIGDTIEIASRWTED